MTDGPLDLLRKLVEILDEMQVPYALGGSLAASMLGEPRTTVDVDVAVSIEEPLGQQLMSRLSTEFYVPGEAGFEAIGQHGSFNLVDTTSALKVDLFVLGESLLDRRQIERRIHLDVPGFPNGLWVTAPVDQILRKLDWYRAGGGVSDRQWRDVVSILRVQREALDLDDLRTAGAELSLSELIERAFAEARSDS